MEENSTKEISLIDLVKLFQKKFKALVVIALIAAILGGVAGCLLTVFTTTYNAELELYVTPADNSNRLLYDLRSGRFAEQLLLESTGLPAKEVCNAADYDAALEAMAKLSELREQRRDKVKEINRFYTQDIDHEYSKLVNNYNSAMNILQMYKNAQTDMLVNDSHNAMIAEYEKRVREAEIARDEYYTNVYSAIEDKKIQMNMELAVLSDQIKDHKEYTDELVEKVLSEWRKDPEVAKQIRLISESVKYEYEKLSYFEGETEANQDADKEALHKGYIMIKISVPASSVPETAESGEAFVQGLIDRYNIRVADYIEQYLEQATGSYEAKCTVLTPIVEIENEPDSMVVEAVKFAAIAGIAGGVLAYLFFVVQMLMKENDEAKAQKESSVANGTSGSSAK